MDIKDLYARWLWRTNTWERRPTYVSYKTVGPANDCFHQNHQTLIDVSEWVTQWFIVSEIACLNRLVRFDPFSDLFNLALADLATLLFAMPAGNHPSDAEKVDFILAIRHLAIIVLSEDFLHPDTERLAMSCRVRGLLNFLTPRFFRVIPSVGSVSVDFRRGKRWTKLSLYVIASPNNSYPAWGGESHFQQKSAIP